MMIRLRKMKTLILGAVLALISAFGVLAVNAPVLALECPEGSLRGAGVEVSSLSECQVEEKKGDDSLLSKMKVIINVALGLIGVVAAVMIIYGGITYATSQGDAAKVQKGKTTLIYGVIGLVVAFLAFAIVNFVLDGIFGEGGDQMTDPDDSISGGGLNYGGSNQEDSETAEGSNQTKVSKFSKNCKDKVHSICEVDGVKYIRLKDGNLWARYWDTSVTSFKKYKGYTCKAGKKPSKEMLEVLAGKYSGGGLYDELSQLSTGEITVYWSDTKVPDSDNIYLLRASKTDTGIINYLGEPEGNPTYGILCYVQANEAKDDDKSDGGNSAKAECTKTLGKTYWDKDKKKCVEMTKSLCSEVNGEWDKDKKKCSCGSGRKYNSDNQKCEKTGGGSQQGGSQYGGGP